MEYVLLASLGGSSQVITETLWALMNPEKLIDPAHRKRSPVVPATVHLISTDYANPRHYSSVQARDAELTAKVRELFVQYGYPIPEIKIDPLLDPDSGVPLEDIRTQRDNVIYANRVTQVVKEYADSPNISIHMSLAGGRKTMSSYDHSAMMFFGRVQDEMSHVLIEPASMERAPQFWWPDQEDPLLVQVGEDEISTSSPIARVDLINVPFVHLDVRLPKGVPPEALDHDKIVEFVEFERNQEAIIIDAERFCITVGATEVFLTPQQFAFFALFAIARVQAWPGVGPSDEGEGHNASGWLHLRDFSHGVERDGKSRQNTRSLAVLRRLLDRKSDGAQHRDNNLMDQILGACVGETDPTESDRSKLRRQIKNKIDSPFIQSVVLPQTYTGPNGVNIGLEIPAHRIKLMNFSDAELNSDYREKP
ncbi:CRISPR-associated ring nuclease Csm6 [uncultured Aliiroseovarius sp.]|uniref:CRISPR-associated ring nuclease Csm6 n=1 Tax=uncultured Aliiroseovarius sp. TaxID=1658783 RepID=UPI0026190A5A|nr:CRISPR-associated ring nuclease Csm6 [uncultured Aliiroseovarius sp.]